MKTINFNINDKFGSVKIIGIDNTEFYCECDCGNKFKQTKKQLVIGRRLQDFNCKDKNFHRGWAFKGCGDISGDFYTQIKRGAKRRRWYFDEEISLEYLWDLFIKQNKKCALSGLDIGFSTSFRYAKDRQTASLDRINSSIGYTKDNIQWIHKRINSMKHTMNNDEFITFCHYIANRNVNPNAKINITSFPNEKR